MGGKNSKGDSGSPKGLVQSNSLSRNKRRKSGSTLNLNRSSSSPVIAKWRMSGSFIAAPNPITQTVETSSLPRSRTVQTPSSQQRPLTICDTTKQPDIPPSFRLSSKLYRPSSFLAAKANDDLPSLRNVKNISSPANSNSAWSSTAPPPIAKRTGVKEAPANKIPVTTKIAKRLGLSPRFKRKIVETITNKVSNHCETNNNQKLTTVSLILISIIEFNKI